MSLEDIADEVKKPKKAKKAEKAEKVKSEKKTSKEKKSDKKEKKPSKDKAKKAEKPAKATKSAKAEKASKTSKAVASDKSLAAAVKAGKPSGVKVVYTEAATVSSGLTDAFVSEFNKAYSEKAVAKVSHDNKNVEKALKSAINVSAVRDAVLPALSKKAIAVITKAVAKSEKGKLTAAEYKEEVAKIKALFG